MCGGTLLVVGIVMALPMILRLERVAHRFAIKSDATRFVGRYRRWGVITLTGRVVASKTTTTVQSTGPTYQTVYANGERVGDVRTGGYVSSTVHDTFRIADAYGQQHSVSVANFYADVNPGDVVTVAYATKGRTSRVLVVVNHTTRRQYANDVTIHEITSPHHVRLVGAIILAGFSVVGIPVMFAYALVERHQRQTFYKRGVQPVWTKGSFDAQALAP